MPTATSSNHLISGTITSIPNSATRRPRFVIDENGKERLIVEGKRLGNPRGIGRLGAVGVRAGRR